ncbi:MAG: glycine betaine ABC transporter substrate-binding protein [Pseudomonadota bacterium]
MNYPRRCFSRLVPRTLRKWLRGRMLCGLFGVLLAATGAHGAESIVVGSKIFVESHILGEIAAQRLESVGLKVERKLGLGGTLISYEALKVGELDLYPEYTGTLIRAVFEETDLSQQALQDKLQAEGLVLQENLGFNNSYAIAVPSVLAKSRGLNTVSDLIAHPDLRFGFTHEFMNRADGWPALRSLYNLPQEAVGIEHALAYRAMASGDLEGTDAYTTDGELELYDLVLLQDDRELFPRYDAAFLSRLDLPPTAIDALEPLAGLINEQVMQTLNRKVASEGRSPAEVARAFLLERGLAPKQEEGGAASGMSALLAEVGHHTLTHLRLTFAAVSLGCVLALPLSMALSRNERWASAIQYFAGLVQTVPALALLALMIPLFGLGERTAIAALFLYSLLPIVRNTIAGLAGVDPILKDVAASLGMTTRQQLLKVELPLALPTIMAGIKTAAVISIGTATLAAFVGAGGLGEPILTGISLSDNQLILQGAIPAAVLALLTEFAFSRLTQGMVPAHLRPRR